MMPIYMSTESVADQTDNFVDAFVCENIVYGCDVVMTAEVILF